MLYKAVHSVQADYPCHELGFTDAFMNSLRDFHQSYLCKRIIGKGEGHIDHFLPLLLSIFVEN